jgi:Zn-dependent protease with chaperone function
LYLSYRIGVSGLAGLGFIDVAVDWFSWLLSIVVVDPVRVLASLFGVFLSFTVLGAVLYWLTRLRVAERTSARLLSCWLTVLLQKPVWVYPASRALQLLLVIVSIAPFSVMIYYTYYSEPWRFHCAALILITALSIVPVAVSAKAGVLILEQGRPTRGPMGDEVLVLDVVKEVGRKYGCLGDADVLIWESDGINAFVNKSRGRVRVAVTRGALKRLTREELEAMLAHECGHLDAGLLRRLFGRGYFAAPAVATVVLFVASAATTMVLSAHLVSMLIEPTTVAELAFSTLPAILALISAFILSTCYNMLNEILADLKSVEITGSDALATALSKMELYSGSVNIKDLLKKHLGQKFALLYPVVRAFISVIDAHPPLQLRIHVIKEYHRKIFETRGLTT